MARRYNSADSKRRILSACVQLFIKQGYHDTTVAEILKQADVSSSTFQNIFHAKEGVLMDLLEFMYKNQFASARTVSGEGASPLKVYALETAIQLTITELNENIRDIYVEIYSKPNTAEYVYQHTADELYKIFGKYMPENTVSDFYELDIGSAGIMRAYMARPCDKYFTLEKKLRRFITMSLNAYDVPDEEITETISYIESLDIRAIATNVMKELFRSLAMKFDFTPETKTN